MLHEQDARGTKARVPLSRRPPRVPCDWRGHGRVQDKERLYLPQVLRLRRKGDGRHVAQGVYKGSGEETMFVPFFARVVDGGSFCATDEMTERVSQVMLKGKALGWPGVFSLCLPPLSFVLAQVAFWTFRELSVLPRYRESCR